MRLYSPGDPWSLDQDDVRLPALTRDFGGQPPVDMLVADLEALGVQVPDADRWRELQAVIDSHPTEPAPPDLTATPDQIRGYLDALGAYEAMPTDLVRLAARKGLNTAMAASLHDHADELIAQMRPRFAAAVEALQHAGQLGLGADDDERSLRHAPKELRDAWAGLRTGAATLDKILSIRQRLSLWAGVQPNIDGQQRGFRDAYTKGGGPSGIDWGVVISRPGTRLKLVKPDPRRPFTRWLGIADRLYLPLASELTAEDLLIAYDYDVAMLQAVAVQRLDELNAESA